MKTTSATPMNANRGASAPTSSAISCPVIVVPIFAPMMIHTACRKVIIPEFTKPTTMTVVAEEDWITAVITAPTATPRNRFAVSLSRIRFILLPAAASRPELIICMPYRNRASPPIRLKISVMLILSSSSSVSPRLRGPLPNLPHTPAAAGYSSDDPKIPYPPYHPDNGCAYG